MIPKSSLDIIGELFKGSSVTSLRNKDQGSVKLAADLKLEIQIRESAAGV